MTTGKMGRPATGRKKFIQTAFFDDELVAIKKVAAKQGQTISATVRDLALAGLAAQKRRA